ncbi:MAG TPA: Gfo/Idh/MocA family oxidoreductase [Candidatus Acidoferrales bacterium]|nr:Gfo/Idh/MocA family oxidoreductase [Candidatus Acidoferrales bacterium]
MSPAAIRVAVAGAGEFGRNHVRVWRELEGAELIGIIDTNPERAGKIAAEFGTRILPDLAALKAERVDAVSLAVPTLLHARLGCQLLDAGHDVLVEKPMAASLAEADELIAAARRAARVLQVGQVERFNPAVSAALKIVKRPMFFEVHRLGIFTPRSLDIDVVYDVMIHDLDILLSLVNSDVIDLKAVGIPVITDKVDIAHARIEFATGAVANVTASRVSTERVRKMRFFQEHEYISMDFARQDVLRVRVQQGSTAPSVAAMDALPEIAFEKLPSVPEEPLKAELRSFLDCVKSRRAPLVDGAAGRRALALADRVMEGILDHARRVKVMTGALESRAAPEVRSFTPLETR